MAGSTEALPVVDLSPYLDNPDSDEAKEACKKVADIIYNTSCLVIKDRRVPEEKNSRFLDMVERYFDQPTEVKMKDVRPQYSYQVGATPEGTERPRDHSAKIINLKAPNDAHIPSGPDAKWRYFWRIGSRPEKTEFAALNAEEVVPEAFPEWPQVMNEWGGLMIESVKTVAEMLAIGLGLEKDAITSLLPNGPHLLAPTGSDLGKYNALGQIFAGFHYDLNLLTIHGKSRFPGLFIWLRDGTKYAVRVPDGCLLLQAGKQLEWLTGGQIQAGFHEVVVTEGTLAAVEKVKAEGRPLWRISSTLFSHVASDRELQPLGKFSNPEALEKYPPTKAGHQVASELAAIKLFN